MAAQDPYKILQHSVSTEKAVRLMEAENTLVFIVTKKATKRQIKWAFEKAFGAKVARVRTTIQHDGRKKAYIKLKPETLAVDITTQLGLT